MPSAHAAGLLRTLWVGPARRGRSDAARARGAAASPPSGQERAMSDLKIVLPGNAPPGADEAGAQRVYTIAAGSGIDRVLRERVRQVLGEGYDAERDDAYVDG